MWLAEELWATDEKLLTFIRNNSATAKNPIAGNVFVEAWLATVIVSLKPSAFAIKRTR